MGILAVVATTIWSFPFAFSALASEEPSDARAVHVVLIWLKEPGNQDHRHTVIEATRGFSHLPGIEQIRIGAPIPSDRATVDASFDVGLYMVFESTSALDAYLAHPEHKQAQKSILGSLVRKVLVYDFYDDRD